MSQVKYTKDHEYIIVEDGTGTVGITDNAQHKLGDITFVEMPVVGRELKKGDSAGRGRICEGGKRRLHARQRRRGGIQRHA